MLPAKATYVVSANAQTDGGFLLDVSGANPAGDQCNARFFPCDPPNAGGGSPVTVRHLHHLSLALFLGGVLLTIAAITLSLSALWTLSGLLLAIAGAVKVVVVYLWRNVIQIEHVEGTVHKG